MKKIKVLNVDITPLTKEQLNGEIRGSLKGKRILISKVNSEFLLRSLKSEEFATTLEKFDLNVADGIGVLWAAKYLSLPFLAKKSRITNFKLLITIEAVCQMVYSGASLVFYPKYCRYPIPEAFRGVDMMHLMLDFAEKEKLSVYLFGAPKETLEKTVENIRNDFKNILIAGSRNGYDFKDEEIVKAINDSGAEIIFVALGSPQQEYWIRDNISKLNSIKIAVGEGGSFNFIAGTYKRAPRWMRTLAIEWLWRLFANKNTTTTEKSRISRVWKAVPVFIYQVVRFKLKNK